MRKITNEELGRPSAEEFAAMEKMPVTVVLDNVRSAQNVGAFFRTGDAFAVERIVLCRYADLHSVMTDAVERYVRDVKECDFPNEKEQY